MVKTKQTVRRTRDSGKQPSKATEEQEPMQDPTEPARTENWGSEEANAV